MPLTIIESLAIEDRRSLACASGSKVDADLPQESPEDFVGVEKVAGDRPRRTGVPLIIGQDSFGPGGSLVERTECHEALADGQMPAEAGVLHERRLARGEITDRSI